MTTAITAMTTIPATTAGTRPRRCGAAPAVRRRAAGSGPARPPLARLDRPVLWPPPAGPRPAWPADDPPACPAPSEARSRAGTSSDLAASAARRAPSGSVPFGGQGAAQQVQHDRAGRRPQGRVAGQALGHRLAQGHGQRVQVREGGGRAADGREHHRLGPGQHVGGRRGRPVGRGDAVLDHPRARGAHDDVLGTEIAVHQPGLVDRGQPGRAADGHGLELQAGKRAVVGDGLQQRSPGHVLADQERVVVHHARVDDPGGAERRHPGRRAGLGREPVPLGRVRVQLPRSSRTATSGPDTALARKTGPLPGMPEIRPDRRYRPTRSGSSVRSGVTLGTDQLRVADMSGSMSGSYHTHFVPHR